MPRRPVPPCVGEGLLVRRVVMAAPDVVFFKGVIEASEGLACVFAERGGELDVTAPDDRGPELDAVLEELGRELEIIRCDATGPRRR